MTIDHTSVTGPTSDATSTPATPVGTSFVDVLNVLLRKRRHIFGTVALFAMALLAFGLWTRDYSAHARFVSTAPAVSGSALARVATQFGISTGGLMAGSEGTPSFYARLVQTDALLAAVATTEYRFATERDATDSIVGSYLDIVRDRSDTPDEALRRAVDALAAAVSTGVDYESGIVTVTVRAPWPILAEQLGRRILSLVDSFNVRDLQLQARQERRFLEDRLAQAQQDLTDAETAVARFLDANRAYQNSARLVFEFQRLQREADLRHTLFITLSQSYEQARVSEVRDTPVVTVVDPPEGTARSGFSPLLLMVIALGVGVPATCSLVLAFEYIRRGREEGRPDVAELATHLANLRQAPRRWFRLTRRD
jgi:uncharacterized protein involved in exopolysaccharide biosynthesis